MMTIFTDKRLVERNDLTAGFHSENPVAHVDQKVAQRLDLIELVNVNARNDLGGLHFATGQQPGREMVATGMEFDRLGRHDAQTVAKIGHGARPRYFLTLSVSEDEVAETEVAIKELRQPLGKELRFFVHKRGSKTVGSTFDIRFGRLQKNRQIRLQLFECFGKFETGLIVENSVFFVFDVGDDAEQVIFEIFELLHRLFVVGGQNDFRAAAHAQNFFGFFLQLFFDELGCLTDQLRIKMRQIARIVAHRVFNEQNDANLGNLRVFVGVETVFDVFDHRQKDFRGAVPDEDVVVLFPEVAATVGGHQVGIIVEEQKNRQLWPLLLDLRAGVDRVGFAQAADHHDEIKLFFLQHVECFVGRGDTGNARGARQIQVEIFAEYLFGQQAVLFKRESIIDSCNEQQFANFETHQIMENFAV